MTLAEIRETRQRHEGTHESVFRSYWVVDKVKELLEKNVPHGVILEIIDDLMKAPDVAGLYDKD